MTLKDLIKRSGATQRQLALRSGLSASTLSNARKGRTRLGRDAALRLAQATGCKVVLTDKGFTFEGEPKSRKQNDDTSEVAAS